MAVTFNVETGSASSTSTSYASVAQYKQFLEDRGMTADTGTDAVIQGALNTAAEYLDRSYFFLGFPVSSTQALAWPRAGCFNRYRVEVSSSIVPAEIVEAACYLAAQQRNSALNVAAENIRSESYGPVSKSYAGSSSQKSFPYVDKALISFVATGNRLVRVN
jgi:hypothetical protein